MSCFPYYGSNGGVSLYRSSVVYGPTLLLRGIGIASLAILFKTMAGATSGRVHHRYFAPGKECMGRSMYCTIALSLSCCMCMSESVPPPSYNSVFKRVNASREQSANKKEFVKSLPSAVCTPSALLAIYGFSLCIDSLKLNSTGPAVSYTHLTLPTILRV